MGDLEELMNLEDITPRGASSTRVSELGSSATQAVDSGDMRAEGSTNECLS